MKKIARFIKPFVTGLLLTLLVGKSYAQQYWYDIVTTSGVYSFNYTQLPDQLVALNPVSLHYSFQWLSAPTPVGPWTALGNGSSTSYAFTVPLTQTTYVERVTTDQVGQLVGTSNVVQLQLVSVNWENYNYVREHDVLITGQTNWEAIDQLSIGQKLQTTTYADGIGRIVEKISKQTATPDPTQGGTLWGDVVKFRLYDQYGREAQHYLPYSATNSGSSGLYKTSAVSDQAQYYTTVYNETNPYSNVTFDNSSLERPVNVKDAGTVWSSSNGTTTFYDLNSAADSVQILDVGDNVTDIPTAYGFYPINSLFRTQTTDEKGRLMVVYTDNSNRVILKKIQVAANPASGPSGWACTYDVYDDFGLLRYTIQPEGVNYLVNNSWSFTGTNGPQALAELCFRYQYDAKGRTIIKQAPGAKEIDMVYDTRDRLVFSQDGVQRDKSPGEWLAYFYDNLDRVVETALYETAETSANLQTDIGNAVATTTVAQTGPNSLYPSDLTISSRNTSVQTYIADNSITFAGGFESVDNDIFETEFAPQAPTGVTEPVTAFSVPVSASVMADPTQFTPLRYNYYDDYTYSGVKAFDNGYNNALAYSPGSDPSIFPIAADPRASQKLTGSKVRILGTNTFLTTTYYYNEEGNVTQTLADNILSGVDITTAQYYFDERILSVDQRHTAAGTLYTNFDILTKNIYDQIARLTSVQKKIGTNNFKTVSSYDLDDMGRLKTKHLDPGYTNTIGADLEALTYTYNLQNEITGINKDYALKTAGLYNKWGHFYGQYYGYDNKDGLFTDFQLDGHITGSIWSTQGDDVQREYNYQYDPAGRLSNALYGEKQNTGDSWSNSQMDFSVTGTGGTITYDRNGNLLTMLQRGILPGSQTPVNIDDLQYHYINNLSNKLATVTDNGTAGTANGHLGDFSNGTNTTGQSYVYDDNGNLVIDPNKGIGGNGVNGITYNYLDKPETFQVTGKGAIQFVYDADGNKLQKIYTPQGSTTPTTTTYINNYVYIGDSLQYINFEEGRVRVMRSLDSSNQGYDQLVLDGNIDLPGGARGVYDYFVRDILQNVRMILTEETHSGVNTCTMELARDANEAPIFGQVDNTGKPTAANEVEARVSVSEIPGQSSGGGWTNSTIGNYVIALGNLQGQNLGPNTLMKVMAGDTVSAQVVYYYPDPVSNNSGGTNIVTNVVTALASAIGGRSITPGLFRDGATATNAVAPLNNSGPFSLAVSPDLTNSTGNAPKAYLTVLFFDERFNFISEGSITARVLQAGNGAPTLVIPNVQAPKNGYAYIYVSNESDETVYFDNLQVANHHGSILEEDHYYAYGLKIAGISSRVMPEADEGFVWNKNLFNDKEIVNEADLDWYEYGFRNYDPQIGRFVQLDPMTDDFPDLTPYQYASGDPIANIDLDGLEGESAVTAGTQAGQVLDEGAQAAAKVGVTVDPLATAWVLPTGAQSVKHAAAIAVGKVAMYTGHLALIATRGALDAVANANSVGVYDFFKGVFKYDPVNDYSDPAEKEAYLTGRLSGDGTTMFTASDEVGGGLGGGFAAAGATAGASIVAGGLVALHGLGAGTVAISDAVQVVKQLYILQATTAKTAARENSPQQENTPDAGAMRKLEYESAPYHGKADNAIKSRAPTNGQDALDMSVQVKETSPRRVGIDYKKKEFVVFDRTQGDKYHGHVRAWKDLHTDMQNALKKAGMVDNKGNILIRH